MPTDLFYNFYSDNYWLESFSAPKATIIVGFAFDNCVALKILTLGGTSVTINSFAFNDLTTTEQNLYLSATEMKSGSVNGNIWTKPGRTWTFKSIKQIP